MSAESVTSEINARIAEMDAAYVRALGAWSNFDVFFNSFFSGVSPEVGVNRIETLRAQSIDQWEADGIELDISSQSALDSWIEYGNELLKDLNDFAGYSTDNKLSKVVADTAEKTLRDIPNALPDPVQDYLIFFVIAATAIVMFALYGRVRGSA